MLYEIGNNRSEYPSPLLIRAFNTARMFPITCIDMARRVKTQLNNNQQNTGKKLKRDALVPIDFELPLDVAEQIKKAAKRLGMRPDELATTFFTAQLAKEIIEEKNITLDIKKALRQRGSDTPDVGEEISLPVSKTTKATLAKIASQTK
jgi:hypothetical protein